jgi:hypothetical protein
MQINTDVKMLLVKAYDILSNKRKSEVSEENVRTLLLAIHNISLTPKQQAPAMSNSKYGFIGVENKLIINSQQAKLIH